MADFLGMMKQAAQLQSKMQAMQEELGNVEVEGISGGGLVAVRMTLSENRSGPCSRDRRRRRNRRADHHCRSRR